MKWVGTFIAIPAFHLPVSASRMLLFASQCGQLWTAERQGQGPNLGRRWDVLVGGLGQIIVTARSLPPMPTPSNAVERVHGGSGGSVYTTEPMPG